MTESVRVLLLGCVKQKQNRRLPARDLYCSPLWRGRRAYADATRDGWHILSAQHGLVDPGQALAPYDLALTSLPIRERRQWGERAIDSLLQRYGTFDGILFELHAGAVYRNAIEPGLLTFGAQVTAPLERLSLGAQLAGAARTTAARRTRSAQASADDPVLPTRLIKR